MGKIAIIGGGIAGLACARVLVAEGHEVHVFDKGRGPGGRMSTRRVVTELGEVSFDHGAQYFTARDPDFRDQVDRLTQAGAVAPWLGALVKLHSDGTNSPLANESLHVGTPSMNAVIRALGDGMTISWSTRVQSVRRDKTTFYITSDEGVEVGGFDHIVCAVPAEQVSPLLDDIAPQLSLLAKPIHSLPCWAGLFAFDRPLCMPFDAMRLKDHDSVDFIAANHSKPGRTGPASYVVHARPDWTSACLEEQPHVIATHLLSTLLGFADDRPALLHSSAHRWRYARVDVEQGPDSGPDSGPNSDHVFDAESGIGLCGDWLCGPRVESAWLSGHHLGLAMTRGLATTLGLAMTGQDRAPLPHPNSTGD